MSWKVLVTAAPIEKTGHSALALLQAAGCEIIFSDGRGLPSALKGIDAVIAGVESYSASVLQSPAAANLKIISRWGVGYDAIDVPAATAAGIVITYTPGLTDDAVADYTFALLLAAVRHVPEGHASMRAGLWLPRWGNDFAGKTLGILGFGRIGRAVAQRARGFNLRLMAHDPSPPHDVPDIKFVSLEELLARSDFLSLHTSLTPKTRGIIGEAQLRRMKPTAYLINTARGPLIDEAALLRALNEGWIGGAALDVFSEEPLPPQHPLRSAANLLLSPHQASSTIETGEHVSFSTAKAILDLLQRRRPELILNPEVFTSGKLRAVI